MGFVTVSHFHTPRNNNGGSDPFLVVAKTVVEDGDWHSRLACFHLHSGGLSFPCVKGVTVPKTIVTLNVRSCR